MVRKKNIITSFSYPVDKVDIVEIAEDYAKSKGLSLSELIIECFGNLQEKNEEANHDLSAIGLRTRNRYNMGLNEDLRKYIPNIERLEDIHQLKEINITAQDITKLTGKMLGQKLALSKRDIEKQNRVLPFTYDRSFNI
jgi:hypothetical protein